MSVGYVAVYEQGGNSTPTWTAPSTGQVTNNLNGQCLANQKSLNVAGNSTVLANRGSDAGQQCSPYTDGNIGTRWSSAFSDPQWLDIDLGPSQNICGVTINWETAYATPYGYCLWEFGVNVTS